MPRLGTRRSRYSRRRYTRRPLRRTRVVRRRPTTRRRPARVTRRRILNVASTKKQDVRMPFSNINNPTDPLTNTPSVLSGNILYCMPYIPTAQDRTPSGTAIDLPSYRTQANVYMRGYKEVVRFTASQGSSWIWRRVCFTMKGTRIRENASADHPLSWEVAPNGWTRSITNAWSDPLGSAIVDVIFKGEEGIDWIDVFTAPTDSSRAQIKFDKTRVLSGGNGESRYHQHKMWHPMNSNFHYDDDENGQILTTSPYHNGDIQGMGDYYVVDFLACSSGNFDHKLSFSPTGCLYWHER